ncbi:MAG TPA: quercetin 2,3-dioxygenase [Chloroflexaceae bacterium]|nr:quercetin 2,3-dioxygenase [Chloroflexaceae bacterium]
MSQIVEAGAIIASRGEGQSYWVWGDLYTLKVTGEQSGGSYAAMECEIGPGSGTPLHIHHAEDELLYVIEGEMRCRAGEREELVRAGGLIFIPRGTAHAFRNEGATKARCLLALTPAGFERFLAAIGIEMSYEQALAPAITSEELARAARLAPSYSLELVEGPGAPAAS